eukprot:TRINITY_DN11310_c0_g1_i1.p1 TRINITY_DN11310_c0_g1~~TRINITY_DN11310_c0_g1_i1.p1  ORF type:complete len:227 (+),score=70.90 TRINITY_DN11310_c0_g1_i1:1346-2026(+)
MPPVRATAAVLLGPLLLFGVPAAAVDITPSPPLPASSDASRAELALLIFAVIMTVLVLTVCLGCLAWRVSRRKKPEVMVSEPVNMNVNTDETTDVPNKPTPQQRAMVEEQEEQVQEQPLPQIDIETQFELAIEGPSPVADDDVPAIELGSDGDMEPVGIFPPSLGLWGGVPGDERTEVLHLGPDSSVSDAVLCSFSHVGDIPDPEHTQQRRFEKKYSAPHLTVSMH